MTTITSTALALDSATVLLIEEELHHLLTLMSVSSITIASHTDPSGRLTLAIHAPDAGRSLIGPQGTSIDALEHIVRCVIRRRLHSTPPISLDVNQYRAGRQHQCAEAAQQAAHTVEQTGRPVVLAPMSAADRRAVHTALAAYPSVRTESIGEGISRRVVVRPSRIV